jgi:hypothetical protein
MEDMLLLFSEPEDDFGTFTNGNARCLHEEVIGVDLPPGFIELPEHVTQEHCFLLNTVPYMLLGISHAQNQVELDVWSMRMAQLNSSRCAVALDGLRIVSFALLRRRRELANIS